MTDRKALFQFGYRRSPDQDSPSPARHPVIVVGAGPVGLCTAIDLAQRGVPVVLLDDADRIGEGSRGICYAKRTLEILDRLGVAEPCLEKGVTWKLGKVFQRDELLYAFDLLPEDGHKMPAFINLQQYYLEHALVERAAQLPNLDIRWRNKVIAIEAPQRRRHTHGRDARGILRHSKPIGSWLRTARAQPYAACSVSPSRARSSKIAS